MAAATKSKGLGKGLGALLPTEGIPENAGDSVVELKINDISPNADQPRKDFDVEALNELADSIKENGIIQPIIVQRKGTGYRIVAGERRWRASRIAGLKVIPDNFTRPLAHAFLPPPPSRKKCQAAIFGLKFWPEVKRFTDAALV